MSDFGIAIQIKGLKEAVAAINKVALAMHTQVPQITCKTITEAALATIKELTPGTGRIRNMWHAVQVARDGRAGGAAMIIVNQMSGSPEGQMILNVLESGSKPHKIRPRNKLALHFFLQTGGEIFAKEVNHPGTKPYRMLAQTEDYVMDLMERGREAAAQMLAEMWET